MRASLARLAWLDGAVKLALIGIGVVLVWQLLDVLLLLFLAVLIAVILRGISDALASRFGSSPRLMLALVTIALTLVTAAAAYWIGPALAGQATDFLHRLTSQLDSLRSEYGNSPIFQALTSHLKSSNGLEQHVGSYAFNIASLTFSALGSLFGVVVMSLYLAEAPEMYLNGAIRLMPPAHRPLTRAVLQEMAHDLRRWMLGQFIDMLTVGGLSAIGLYFLGVPVPFALAVLAGLLTIVPYFGALAAGIPGVLVALTQSWMAAVWVVLIFVGCHTIEGYVVAPLVQHRLVQMPPAVVIGALVVASALFGPVGIILGTPLAVVTLVLVRRVYLEHMLGDRIEPTPPRQT